MRTTFGSPRPRSRWGQPLSAAIVTSGQSKTSRWSNHSRVTSEAGLRSGASIRVESDAESCIHSTVISTTVAFSGNSTSEGEREGRAPLRYFGALPPPFRQPKRTPAIPRMWRTSFLQRCHIQGLFRDKTPSSIQSEVAQFSVRWNGDSRRVSLAWVSFSLPRRATDRPAPSDSFECVEITPD